MDRISVAVKVFFEEPFWIGVVERTSEEGLRVCKVTFGAEPKDCQVAEFFLEHYYRLRFSPAVEAVVRVERLNPKRMQREAHRQVQEAGIGTKSQQALKLQHERLKTERKASGRERKEADQLRKFMLKQQKKKEKHRGR